MQFGIDLLIWFALFAGLGRALLAFLPPGRVGSHRLADLPETLFVSSMLGVWVQLVPLPLLYTELVPLSPVVSIVALALVAIGVIVRVLLLPQALVPQHELPRPRWGGLESALALTFAVAILWPDESFGDLQAWSVFERAMKAVLLVTAASHVTRAVECAGRPTWLGLLVALTTLTPQSPLGCRGETLQLQIQFVTLGIATSLAGWLRRADSRDRALALFGSGALVGIDVRLAVAGLLATLLFTHSNALKSTLRAALLSLAFVAVPTVWAVSDGMSMIYAPDSELTFYGVPVNPLLPLGVVTVIVVASLALGQSATSPQPTARFAGRGREVGAIATLCALPPLFAAFALAVPELDAPELAPLSLAALGKIVAPAAAFLAAITLFPQRKA
ncbi:MAG: hypothetical protein NTV21_00850 [Planctomycetota bacterium]|nr:hypothetical protein [Planctomycetota bacterium]